MPIDTLPRQGQVPQQQAQQSASGVDLVSTLLGQKAAVNAEIAKTLPSALSPVKSTGVSSPHMPGSFEFGVGQPNLPAPQGSRDAKRQGIASTIAGVANIVGQVKQAYDAKQSREFQGKVEKVLQAQDAVSQAKQVPKDSPGFQDAQAVIKKNMQLINDTIDADPKTKKKFEKAFDISFVDPSANDTPEHKAAQAAFKSHAEQLEAKTPDKLIPNVAAQAKLQQLSAVGASLDATTKAILPYATQQMKDVNSNFRNENTQAHADARAVQRDTRQAETNQVKREEVNERWQSAGLSSKTKYGVAGMQIKAAGDRLQKLIDSRSSLADKARAKGNNAVAGKIDEQNAALIQKEVDKMPERINQMIQARDNDVKAGASKEEVDKWNTTINAAKSQGQMYQTMLSQYAKENLNMPPQEQQKGGSNDSTTNAESEPTVTTAGSEEDDSDEDHSDPDDPIYQ